MNLPLIDAAEYFLNLKQAAGEALPAVEEAPAEDGLLQALSEAAKSKLGLAIAYRVYSESLRDPSNSAIGEHFKEHSEDCLNDVDFFVRRSSVMSGGASLEGVESPPASGDLTEILQVLSKMEEANLQLMSELVVLLEGNPSKYEVEAMMAKDQHHLDDLTQHMPVAPELPSVAEELPSVEEAAPPGVIGPAKVAAAKATGLKRVGQIFSGSRVRGLKEEGDASVRAGQEYLKKSKSHREVQHKLLRDRPNNERPGFRELLSEGRANAARNKGGDHVDHGKALRNEAIKERAKQVGAIGGTAAAATGAAVGAHKLLSKKEAGVSASKGLARVGELLTGSRAKKLTKASDKALTAASSHLSKAEGHALTSRKALDKNLLHTGRKAHEASKASFSTGSRTLDRSQALHAGAKAESGRVLKTRVGVGTTVAGAAGGTGALLHGKKNEGGSSAQGDGKIASMQVILQNAAAKRHHGKEKTSEMGAAAMGQHSPVAPPAPLNGAAAGQHPKLAQRTYDMGGSKRDGKAYSMHTTPDDYELSQLISSKMDGDLRGVRGKAKNEGMLVGSGLGAVKGLKAGKGWGGGEVIRTGGGGGTVIGTFGSGGKMPKGMGADIRENQGMIRDELRGQGIKIGGLAQAAQAGAGRLAGAVPHIGSALQWAAHGAAPAALAAGAAGAVGGAVAGGEGHRLSGALKGGVGAGIVGGAAGGLAGAGAHRFATRALSAAAPKLAADKIGYRWDNESDESVARYADHGSDGLRYGAPIAGGVTGALMGRTPAGRVVGAVAGAGLGHLVGVSENSKLRNMARAEEIQRHQHRLARAGQSAEGKKEAADKSDSELAETGRQRAVANLASGFTSDKHTSGERHGTLAGRLGGAAVGAGAGALASKGATLPVRLAAGMGGAVIGGSMGGQIGKTIGSDHDAEKFWANHKEAAGVGSALAGMGEKAVAALGKRGITHAGQLGGTLTHAAVGALPGAVIGAAGGAAAGGEGHRLSGALTGGVLGGAAGAAAGAGGKKLLTKALDKANTAHDPFGALKGPIRPGTGSLDHLVPHAGATPSLHAAPDLSHFAPPGAAPLAHGAPTNAIPAGPRRPATATDFHVPAATPAPEPMASASLAAPDVSKFNKPRWKIAQAKQAGLVDSARSLISRVTSRPTVSGIGKTLQSVEHSGEGLARKALSATTAPGLATHVPVPTTGTLPSAVSYLHAPSGGSTLDLDLHHMAQEKRFHDSQPSWARKAITESKYVRPSGTAPDLPTPSSAGRMTPEVAAALARASKNPGETAAQAMVRLSKVAAMRQLGYSSSGSALVRGDKEMSPVLGKRVIRNAKQVWDKAVKQAMGEEAPVEQYLQEEAAGRQAQEAAESDYLRQQLQQTSQQLEQTQAQVQEQGAQVGEMQGTIEQLQGQQAEQAQAADAAVQTARQTAEAAMSQSMQRSAELMKQTQLAAGLQNAAATMKEQLMALSQTPVPPATVGEAGELDAAAQQQVGQDQAMEEQAAMEEEAQMAAAQGAPPAAAPTAPPAAPKTASLGRAMGGAGQVLSKAPSGVAGAVLGAGLAAGTNAMIRGGHETAFLQDAVRKLEQKHQGGFATGMALAEARMRAEQSSVMDQHPGKAALIAAARGARAGFAVDTTLRSIIS